MSQSRNELHSCCRTACLPAAAGWLATQLSCCRAAATAGSHAGTQVSMPAAPAATPSCNGRGGRGKRFECSWRQSPASGTAACQQAPQAHRAHVCFPPPAALANVKLPATSSGTSERQLLSSRPSWPQNAYPARSEGEQVGHRAPLLAVVAEVEMHQQHTTAHPPKHLRAPVRSRMQV